MQVVNNADADGTALALNVQPGEAPVRVNSDRTVTNLNADRLDGQDADALAEPRGYAHDTLGGAVDTPYPSRGLIVRATPTCTAST
jgi:hypothetical protein